MIKTGSINDGKHTGLAHLLEHMLFTGNKNNPGESIFKENIVKDGNYVNGATGYETTSYYIKGHPSKLISNIRKIAEIIKTSNIDDYQLEGEKNVVFNEMNIGKDDNNRYFNRLSMCDLYKNSLYSNIGIGNEKTLKNIEKHHLLAYIKSQYIASNCIIGIKGKLNYNVNKILNVLKEEFDIKNLFSYYNMESTHLKFANYMKEYKYFNKYNKNINNDKLRKNIKYNWGFTSIEKRDINQTYINIKFSGFQLIDNNNISKNKTIMKIIKNYLSFGLSGMLKQKLRSENKLIYTIKIYNSDYSYNGFLNINYSITPSSGSSSSCTNVEKSLCLIFETLKELKEKELNDKVLKDVIKRYYLKKIITDKDVLNNLIEDSEEYLFANLNSNYYKNEIKQKTTQSTKSISSLTKLNNIKPTEIKQLATEIFNKDKMHLFIVSPVKVKLNFNNIKNQL